MSDPSLDKCEFPTKNWEKFSQAKCSVSLEILKDMGAAHFAICVKLPAELKRYFVRNMDKCDCSFILIEMKIEGTEPMLESFQWIVREMSTTLEKLLNTNEIKAQNYRLIPITDPNFETILTFGHTKTLEVDSFDELIDLYGSAYHFNIQLLRDAVLEKIKESNEVIIDWINFFRVAYMTKSNSFYSELYEIFHQKILKMNTKHIQRELKLKTEMLLNFDPGRFYEFFDAIKSRPIRPLLCFQIIEAYVLKNIFKDNDPIPAELQGNTTKDTINLFLATIAFEKMSQKDFQNGPGKCIWIDETVKGRLLKRFNLGPTPLIRPKRRISFPKVYF